MLLLLLTHFCRVRLCATPLTAAHQAPLSLGFSRQEHWSGLPFPSPMHEREKWKWSRSVVSDSLRPHGLQPTRPLRPWDFPGKSTGVGCHCLLWVHSIAIGYFYIFQSDHHDKSSYCHPTKILHNYWLYSPHCIFHVFMLSCSVVLDSLRPHGL